MDHNLDRHHGDQRHQGPRMMQLAVSPELLAACLHLHPTTRIVYAMHSNNAGNLVFAVTDPQFRPLVPGETFPPLVPMIYTTPTGQITVDYQL